LGNIFHFAFFGSALWRQRTMAVYTRDPGLLKEKKLHMTNIFVIFSFFSLNIFSIFLQRVFLNIKKTLDSFLEFLHLWQWDDDDIFFLYIKQNFNRGREERGGKMEGGRVKFVS